MTLALLISLLSIAISILSYRRAGDANTTADKSLLVSKDQLEANRTHNRLTVKPFLTSMSNFKLTIDPAKTEATIAVTNSGVGPAFVDSFEIYVDGTLMTGNMANLWKNVLDALGIRNRLDSWHGFVMGPKSCILAGQSVHLLTAMVNRTNLDAIMLAMTRAKIVIRYRSLYDDLSVMEAETDRPQAPMG